MAEEKAKAEMDLENAVEVSKEVFFKHIARHGDRHDPMPSLTSPVFTDWIATNTSWITHGNRREVLGRSYPGWKNPGEPSRYFIVLPPI